MARTGVYSAIGRVPVITSNCRQTPAKDSAMLTLRILFMLQRRCKLNLSPASRTISRVAEEASESNIKAFVIKNCDMLMEPFNHQTTDSHRLRHSNVTIISVS